MNALTKSLFSFHSSLLLSTVVTFGQIPQRQTENVEGSDKTLDVGDPISTSSGAFHFTQPLLNLGGGPLTLDLELFYTSTGAPLFFPHLPPTFQLNHLKIGLIEQFNVATNRNIVQVQSLRGIELNFRETAPQQWEFFDNEEFEYQLHETADFFYLLDPQNEEVLFFEKIPEQNNVTFAFLTRLQDRNGNALTYTNDPDPLNNGVQSITDSLGRSLSFTYATVGTTDQRPYLQTVTDHTGRTITFTYEDNPADNPGFVTLRSITDPIGGETVFAYDRQHRITAKQLPNGNTPVTQVYIADEFSGQTLSQTDADGLTTTFEVLDPIPGLGDTRFQVTYPDETVEQYHHGNNGSIATAITDALGKTLIWKLDSNNRNRVIAAQSRDGSKVAFTYHQPSGKLASETDRAGNIITNTFTPQTQTFTNSANSETFDFVFHNLTQINHPDGTTEQFTHDPNGNILTATNRAGDTSTSTYDSQGRILTITNAEGGIATNTYNAAGLPATQTDSDTGSFTFLYDARSNPISITQPDGSTITATFDDLDRLIDTVDEDGIITRRTYDANSNLTSETRAQGTPLAQTTTFEYDAKDRLFRTTDPAGGQITHTFTHFDRVATTTFEDETSVSYEHTPRRNISTFIDEQGNRALLEYNKREHISAFISALGRRSTFERDPRGPINQNTDPSGDTFKIRYDSVARIIAEIDGLGRQTTFAYDGEGRLTSRTEPTLGTTTYDYDGNGLLDLLTDAKTGLWDFTRTTMGRVTQITDPNNRDTNRTYDNRGRIQTQTNPDGIIETLTYNADSTLASRTFTDGLSHTFSYDALNRLVTCNRSLNGITDTSSFTYDSRNNITSTTVNGLTITSTFDERNRLETLTYPNGMVVTYTYNAIGLVTRVTDSLTNTTINLSYDSDRQLTQVTRSNGTSTSYTYDAEALPETVTHNNGATLAYDFNRGDEPTSINDIGFPVQTNGVAAAIQTLTFNTSSDITSSGFTSDSRGRRTADPLHSNYTWDSDNRLIFADKDGATVNYRYDCLGRLLKRTQGSNTTDYLYSSAINLFPIIGEQENGNFTRFYIALPDGRLLYFIDNPASAPESRFYHYGKTGNVRFLTDSTGTVTDSYRYAAFGKLLQNSGSSEQIYTFVGEFGVRTDPTLETLHMRDRYYDPHSQRFISRDPIFEVLLATNNLSSNPFQYGLNSPSINIDPTGQEPKKVTAEQLANLGSLANSGRESINQIISETISRIDPSGGSRTHEGSEAFRFIIFLSAFDDLIANLPENEQLLINAALAGNTDKVQKIINQGVDPQRVDEILANLVQNNSPVGPLLPLLLLFLRLQKRHRETSQI